MSNQKIIQEELRSLGSSLPVLNSPVFSVPDGYFEGLAAVILAKVKSEAPLSSQAELNELSPLLASIPKVMPYAVPTAYFQENLDIPQSAETETPSPVLGAIGKQMPYGVPAGYFDAFPAQVLKSINRPTARVVPLFARRVVRIAAAAAVAGALLWSGLRLFSDKPLTDTASAPAAQPTAPAVAQNVPALKKEISRASTKELEAFVKDVPVATTASAKPIGVKAEADDLLKDVSVNEMESFLSAVSANDDDLSATN